MMGGICSRKRNQQVMEDTVPRGVSSRYCKSSSSKWLAASFYKPAVDGQPGGGSCPTLLELCIQRIRQVLDTCFRGYVYFCEWKHMFYLPDLNVGHCNRTLIDIIHFQCCQGMLVNRYSTNWYIAIVLLMFLLKPSETVLSR